MPSCSDTDQQHVVRVQVDRPIFTQDQYDEVIRYELPHAHLSFKVRCERWSTSLQKFFCPVISKLRQKRNEKCDKEENWERSLPELQDGKSSKTKHLRRRTNTFLMFLGLWLAEWFPFIKIMRKYEWKTWLPNDIIAGLTTGIMHVPQGMAYAVLATLPPVYGLYTSLFPPLVYFLLGTSRHISIGTIAVVSLLTGEYLQKVVMLHQPATESQNRTSLLVMQSNTTDDMITLKMAHAPALACGVGLFQIGMALLHLGGVMRYLSEPMTAGFTVGVAVHVATSQLQTVLGLSFSKPVGVFTIPRTYYELLSRITDSNVPTICLSIVCIVILTINKELINPRVVKRCRVPIPMDLIIVILATITSYYLKLNAKHKVKIIGDIPLGIPPPEPPNLSLLTSGFTELVVIAVVAFTVNMSLARIYAKRMDHKIDSNQELYAYGFANLIGSCFHTFPCAASLSRSAVFVATGGKTQLAALFSSFLLIAVLYFVGNLFYNVPNCVLSAMILVALKGMFMEAGFVKQLWLYSIWETSTWIITFLCTVFLDVKLGMIIGVAYSALALILQTQASKASLLWHKSGTEIYHDVSSTELEASDKVRVVRYEGSIFYASAENFRQAVYETVKMDPSAYQAKRNKLQSKLKTVNKRLGIQSVYAPSSDHGANYLSVSSVGKSPTAVELERVEGSLSHQVFNESGDGTSNGDANRALWDVKGKLQQRLKAVDDELKVKHVIFDCSRWALVDIVGAEILHQVITEYDKIGVSVSMVNLKNSIYRRLTRSQRLPVDVLRFPTVHDAVLATGTTDEAWSGNRAQGDTSRRNV